MAGLEWTEPVLLAIKAGTDSGAGTGPAVRPRSHRQTSGINVFGPLYVASEAAKRLREGGRIINFSSSVAKYPVAGAGLYSAAKKAVESFTESWAREAAIVADDFTDLLGARPAARVMRDDRRAVAGEPERDGPANAAATARDERNLPFERRHAS
ncbi:MAG: SDR family NAD(P)-dependent oxidoreductase, partial [Novosphingobium sp.]|nr:SDR family NAD(P)-dependent oxidoreductase [Novosphingobium sp.]